MDLISCICILVLVAMCLDAYDNHNKRKYKYENATIAAESLGFTRGNITNAIRFKRQIGKQSLQKHWVCYEQDFELFTQISKDSTFAP